MGTGPSTSWELGEGEVCVVERGCVVAFDRSIRMGMGRLGTFRNALLMGRFNGRQVPRAGAGISAEPQSVVFLPLAQPWAAEVRAGAQEGAGEVGRERRRR